VPSLVDSLKAQIPPSAQAHRRAQLAHSEWPPEHSHDPNKLQIILRNLIHNALKFTHHGVDRGRPAASDQGTAELCRAGLGRGHQG
jgi:signal transduction histidine kinase